MSSSDEMPDHNPEALKVLREPKIQRLSAIINSAVFLAIASASLGAGAWYLKAYKECTLAADTLTAEVRYKANTIVSQLTNLKLLSLEHEDVGEIYKAAPGLVTLASDPALEETTKSLRSQANSIDYMPWLLSMVPQESNATSEQWTIVQNLFKGGGPHDKLSLEELRDAIEEVSLFKFLVHYPHIKSVYTNQCGAIDMARREYLGERIPLVVAEPLEPISDEVRAKLALTYRLFDER